MAFSNERGRQVAGSWSTAWLGVVLASACVAGGAHEDAPRTRTPRDQTVAPGSPSAADPTAPSHEAADEPPSGDAPSQTTSPAAISGEPAPDYNRSPDAPSVLEPVADGDGSAAEHDPNPTVPQPAHDEPAQPQTASLPPLPHPRQGACAFEPLPNPPIQVENVHCADGVFRDHIRLDSDAAVERLRGCTRIIGHVDVIPESVTSLRALESLRVIEGDLTVYGDRTCFDPSRCERVTPELSSLAGLENLRCVSGGIFISHRTQPTDFSALQSLVEIGGNFSPAGANAAGTLASLRRVWGDFSPTAGSTAPRLEAVYGRSDRTEGHSHYIGCGGDDYCRDGVLGCAFTATSSAELAQLSKCEIAIGYLEVSGAAVRDLTPLAGLRYAGFLSIHGGGDDTVENLAGLEGLVSATNLTVRGLPRLSTLNALSNLAGGGVRTTQLGTVEETPGTEGSLVLANLPALRTLQGLSGVQSLRRLEITDCDALVDLSGLDALRAVGVLHLEGNTALQSLRGISQLHRAGHISLFWNGSLSDISALAGVDSMDLTLWDLPSLADLRPLSGVAIGDLHVVMLPKLTSLAGLEGIVDGARIDLQKNALLEDVGALAHIEHAAKIQILSNPSLASIDGLAGLVGVTAKSEIDNNAQLPQCEVDALTARIPTITGSQNDEIAACTP